MTLGLKIDEIGYWSEIKLDILKDYAREYNKIICKKKLQPIYIDGFAGAGRHKAKASDRIMSDLFHDKVPDDYIQEVAEVMVQAQWHTFQVLTKRSQRLKSLLTTKLRFAARHTHIWWGVSAENRKHGIPRIQHLRSTEVSVRFLSVEPLLEDLGVLDLEGISWVIVGGESGAGARPMKKEWAISIRDQCQAQGISFFFKQWGGVRKSLNGRELDGRTYDEFPTFGRETSGLSSDRLVNIDDIEKKRMVRPTRFELVT